jgi:hypothetical protein
MLSAYKEKTLNDENGMTFSPSGSFLIKVKKIEIRYFYQSQDGMNKKTPDSTVPLKVVGNEKEGGSGCVKRSQFVSDRGDQCSFLY